MQDQETTTEVAEATPKVVDAELTLSKAQHRRKIKAAVEGYKSSVLELASGVWQYSQEHGRESISDDCENQRLPFSKTMAYTLITVGRELASIPAKQRKSLPSDISPLGEVATLRARNADAFDQLLADGSVHPGLSSKEAQDLRKEHGAREEGTSKQARSARKAKKLDPAIKALVDGDAAARKADLGQYVELVRYLSRAREHFPASMTAKEQERLGAMLDKVTDRVDAIRADREEVFNQQS